MTSEQLDSIKLMSWSEFIKKYGKMLLNGQISRPQYDKLLEIKKGTTKQQLDAIYPVKATL